MGKDKNRYTKTWELFPGKNKFYCDGRILTTKDNKILFISLSLISVTTILFLTFDCRLTLIKQYQGYGYLIPIITIILYLFVITMLLRTSFSDPGVIPRASNDQAKQIEKQQVEEERNNSNFKGYRPPARVKEVEINGITIKLKYCYTCKIFRPPRASHCSICDNCVERFDHHCPWVGNCIGRRNYRYFYLFLISLSILDLFIFVFSIINMVNLYSQSSSSLSSAIKKSWPSTIVLLITFFSMWSVVGLCGFHTYLTCSNTTTNEDMKGAWKKKDIEYNPYSKGNCLLNCFQILCGPVPPSQLKSTEPATQEDFDIYQRNCQLQNKEAKYVIAPTNRDETNFKSTNGHRDIRVNYN
jgi:palmitoyltransferase ZDHHC9/14/18